MQIIANIYIYKYYISDGRKTWRELREESICCGTCFLTGPDYNPYFYDLLGFMSQLRTMK